MMKKHIKYLIGMSAVLGVFSAGCNKGFFNRPPEAGVVATTFYQTASQLNSSTDGLYGAPWFGWNNKVGWAITEMSGGNGISYSSDVSAFESFAVPNDNPELLAAWDSPFSVVAQCNGLINNITANTPASAPATAKNNALGEAHLMRGVAYFYLVRTFGNVPLIENPLNDINNFQTIPTNPVSDVYKFIVRDLLFAEANCYTNTASSGHGDSGSASAMLAKVYLYMQDYTDARKEAEKVINSGEFSLLPNFEDVFTINHNNSKESILAMQWISTGGYDFGNSIQASWAFSSSIDQTTDGYGELGPSIDLQNAFAAEGGDTTRRHGTYMIHGSNYPELTEGGLLPNGYVFPASGSAQGTDAACKKYVVGAAGDPDNLGKVAAQAAGINTYIIRYADVLLIDAEAIMGQTLGTQPGGGIDTTATCTDPTAIADIDQVRARVGVPALRGTFTYKQLLLERRCEFALEQDYWFDLGRIDGYNVTHHPVATNIIDNQQRGTYSNDVPPVVYSAHYPVTDANFVFPVPVIEATADPNLLKTPVPYVFK
jgi:hypothetical protein